MYHEYNLWRVLVDTKPQFGLRQFWQLLTERIILLDNETINLSAYPKLRLQTKND